MVLNWLEEHIEVAERLKDLIEEIGEGGNLMAQTILQGGKILLFGNGGSASDAQHIAAELVGRYKRERPGLPAVALTTDTSILTAVGNDYAFKEIFARQVEGLGRKGDLIIALSTSGNSPNVIAGVEKGLEIGLKVVTLTGKGGGKLGKMGDINIIVPSQNTPRIQEMHILIGHMMCEIVDQRVTDGF